MKITLAPRETFTPQQDPAQKIAEALALLTAEFPAARREQAEALARVLEAHTPLSYFIPLTSRQIADLIAQSLEFLGERQGDVGVRCLPFAEKEKGRSLFLANAPDCPYLLDSVQNFLQGEGVRFGVISHPILNVRRKKDGSLSRLGDLGSEGQRESFLIFDLDGVNEEVGARLEKEVRRILGVVLQVQHDQRALRQGLKTLGQIAEMEPFHEFWHWLQDGNFLPFASVRLELSREAAGEKTVVTAAESLGPFLWPEALAPQEERPLEDFSRSFRERLLRSESLVVEEVDRISPVYRSERLVYLGFREKTGENRWVEHAFLGLFSQKSVDELTSNIPPLRRRIEKALETLRIPRNCHDFRKTVEIFNTFPKVELFFLAPEELVQIVGSFTLLYRQGAVKVVAVPSLAVRGVTLLVIMPREYHTLDNMSRIETYLQRYFRSSTIATKVIHISADYLSLHVGVNPESETVHLDLDRLERGLSSIARPWELKLRLLLRRFYGEAKGAELWRKYRGGLSREYRALTHPRFAFRDIRRLEEVLDAEREVFDLWGPLPDQQAHYRLQFYSYRESTLNALMPFFENLNLSVLDEVDFTVQAEGKELYIKSFAVRCPAGSKILAARRALLLETLTALRRGEAENDLLHRLLLSVGLSRKEIDVFRGYQNYYFQLGSPFTKRRVAFALIHNPEVALLLFRYFEARFRPEPEGGDPLQREEGELSPLRQKLAAALEAVDDVNEDRILRILFNLIDSTVRTNFFVRRDRDDYFFAFKISAIGIIDMPVPRPLYEIYVHSATMEGIHLRGGKVARGGIRWSDRPDDFRTEILGLMKTQMTKNALIVPVGSKGGFIVKTPFRRREQGSALAKAAYQTLMRGLLDLTDNRVGGQVVAPEGIVAYDEEDPYLVVAADKGTAHLSDTANAISREYRFWLDDAFASGGSHGYDHKELGITARGAWEGVKRHFREMGIDIQSQPFTVVGIGDMSGDVFGNGMLLSRQTRLLAAFDHRHIFLDPDPDPETSYLERQRLYNLPRSSWDDYDRGLISAGGGVYPRDAKDIPLSPQVRRWLNVRHESTDGQGLIRLLLASEVDLLWNGGIGTYVKASTEKQEDAGDHTNDGVRIDAPKLRARVVGEGGNLGLTQKARIEYALAGGRINTDAVDNSAGVDCSDHEVNLKIFMQHLREVGRIDSREERDRLLAGVTDEVCQAVLFDNYSQSLCLSLDAARCAEEVHPFLRLAERLAGAGLLDRHSECLPATKEVLARVGQTFTRPELAVLMAYSKMQLFHALLESDLPQGREMHSLLLGYFPEPIRARFGDLVAEHPLAREIAATLITNRVIDQAGSAFAGRLVRETGASLVATISAYLTFDRILEGPRLRQELHALDNRMAAERQYRLLADLEKVLTGMCGWSLTHDMRVAPDEETVAVFRQKAEAFEKNLGGILPGREWERTKALAASLEEEGLGADTARRLAALPHLEDLLPLVGLGEKTGGDLYSVARSYCEVRDSLGIPEILEKLAQVPLRDRWDRLALRSLREEISSVLFDLTLAMLQQAGGNLEGFFAGRRQKLTYYRTLLDGLRGIMPVNFHPFTVLGKVLASFLV